MTAKDFHVGQTVYVYYRGFARGASALSSDLVAVKVRSVGRKWLYLDSSVWPLCNRFCIENGFVDSGCYMPEYRFTTDPIDYYDEIDRSRIIGQLTAPNLSRCSLTQLRRIAEIAKVSVTLCDRKYPTDENT